MIKLIVGLGNPGAKYLNTRHNVGFWVVDAWAVYENQAFVHESKFRAEVAKINASLRLVKPQTYMNLSGESVIAVTKYFDINIDEILVIHDEIDLPCGVVRVKKGGGNAGHNGLKSLTQHLGSPDFWRMRIGVGRPANAEYEVVDYVLGKPDEQDEGKLIEVIDVVLDWSEKIAAGDMEAVKQFFHERERKGQ